MPLFSRIVYAMVRRAARKGLAAPAPPAAGDAAEPYQRRARGTGLRGETFAYWYLRSRGYIFIARNFTVPGVKGEIDLIGYDGEKLAFVEVKTRTGAPKQPAPEEAVNEHKRDTMARIARSFLTQRGIPESVARFDVLAIESRPGQEPVVRLHKGVF